MTIRFLNITINKVTGDAPGLATLSPAAPEKGYIPTMKRISNSVTAFLRRFKIQKRLLAVSLSLALLPVLIIGIYAYQNYTHSIRLKVSRYAEQTTKLLGRILQLELRQYSAYIDLLSASYAEQNDFSSARLRELIRKNSGNPQYLRNVQIISPEGQVVYDLGYNLAGAPPVAFHRAIDTASPNDCLCYIDAYGLLLGRKIYSLPAAEEHIGYVFVYIDPALLRDRVFNGINFGEGSRVLLITADGSILSSTEETLPDLSSVAAQLRPDACNDGWVGADDIPSFSLTLENTKYFVIYNYSQAHGCYFAATVPESYLTSETHYISAGLFLLAAILFLVSFAVTMAVYDSIINPIKNIEAHCNVIADSAVDEKINDTHPDEIGFLARVIDRLVAELKAMAYQWQLDQARKRELELRALQYQINPHFLFNTLNSLKWVAEMNEVPVLYNGIESLSSLLQNTLIKKDEMIPLSEELENLRHYFSIQKIRYGDCFDVLYSINENLEQYPVPRFILQPLAENAVIHGTALGGKPIQISVTGHAGTSNDIVLCIEDNGAGFSQNALPISSGGKFSGIGLSNVDERLKLYYGAGYGLHLSSTPGRGTRCEIRLPFVPRRKEGI